MKIGGDSQFNMAGQLAEKGRVDAQMAKPGQIDDIGKIKKLAGDFEAIFNNIVLKSMRSSIQKTGLISGGNAEDIYQSMLDSEYSKIMAKSNQSSLGQAIERFLIESSGISPTNADKNRGLAAYGSQTLQNSPKQEKIDMDVPTKSAQEVDATLRRIYGDRTN